MTARNLFGALALDTTVAAARDLLTTIRDSVTGVLKTRLDSQTITGTIAANNVSFGDSVDASAYRGVAVAVSGTFVGNFQFETSVDGVAWSQQQLNYSNSFGAGFANSGTGYVIAGALFGRYFRVRSIAWTSGTATVSITFTSNAPTATVNNPSLATSTNRIGNVAQHYATLSGTLSALNAVVDGATDLAPYASVRVQVIGSFVGLIIAQTSNDAVNWATQYLSTGTGDSYPYFSAAGRSYGDIGGRYFRVLMSSYTSGTATVNLVYSAAPSPVSNRQAVITDLAGNSINITSGSPAAGTAALVVAQKPRFLTVTGTIAALNAVVDGTNDLNIYSSVRIQTSGTWSGTLSLESSADGTNWQAQYLTNNGTNSQTNAMTTNTLVSGDLAGRYFRARASAWTSGTAVVSLLYSAAPRATPGSVVSLIGSTVKSPNTASIPSDGALVVASSPNTPLPVGANAIGTVGNNSVAVSGTTSAAGTMIDGALDLLSYASVRVQIAGTWVGTLQFEASSDGVIWSSITLTPPAPSSALAIGSSLLAVTSTTGNGTWSGTLPGRYFRVNTIAWTSGTATVNVLYSAAPIANAMSLLPSRNVIGTTRLETGSITGTIAALNATTDGTTDVSPYGSVRLQTISTSFVGTLTFQVSNDGVNWSSRPLMSLSSSTLGTTVGTSGNYYGPIGAKFFRVLATAYTSGSIAVNIVYSAVSESLQTQTALAGGINTIGSVWIGPGSGRAPLNFNRVSTADTNAVVASNTSRWLQELSISNPTSTPAYFKIYNQSTTPNVGVDVPRVIIPVPGNSTIVSDWGPNGKFMTLGLSFAITGGIAVGDTSAAPAGILVDGSYA